VTDDASPRLNYIRAIAFEPVEEQEMARRPVRPPRPDDGSQSPPLSGRDKIIAAFFALLAEQAFENIEYADIAARAGVSLETLRTEFGSKFSIVAAYVKAIDRKVLAGGDADMAEEPARERLFDVLMRRLEAMYDNRPAIRSLMRSARRHPGLALALSGLALRSQRWMLTAANIGSAGPRGLVRAQGLALLLAGVMRTYLDDDDEGLARTMAELDRALGRGQRWSGFLDDVCRLVPRSACLPTFRRRRDRTRDADRDIGGEEVVAL
jgi:AcrR family transcriptional regulator